MLERIQAKTGIRKEYVAVVLGFVTVLALEGFLYYQTNNDFFLRYHTEAGHYTRTLRGVNRNLNHYPIVILNRVNESFAFFGYFGYAFMIAGLYIIYKRDIRGIILLTWFAVLLFYMQYGSMSFTSYILIQRIWRFLSILSIPTCVIIAYFLADIRMPARKVFIAAVLVFLTASSLYYTRTITDYMDLGMTDFRETAKFLRTQPRKEVYSDYDTIGKLNYLLRYNRQEYLKNIENIRSADEIHDAYVVIDASRGVVEVREIRNKMPEFYRNPPGEWQLVKTITESDKGYYATYDTKIYYAP